MRIIFTFIAATSFALGGCQDKQELVPAPVVHTPLALDPTENLKLPSWWRNDRVMLHFAADGEYRMFQGANRYRRPIETGRWSQSSYAVVNLKPYRRLNGEPFEARIDRVAGMVTLKMPDMPPMNSIARPPRVTEDFIIGAWGADDETIVVLPDMSFELRKENQPIGARPMRGGWIVDNEQLILTPQTSAERRLILRIERNHDGIVSLRGAKNTFQRLNSPSEQNDA